MVFFSFQTIYRNFTYVFEFFLGKEVVAITMLVKRSIDNKEKNTNELKDCTAFFIVSIQESSL